MGRFHKLYIIIYIVVNTACIDVVVSMVLLLLSLGRLQVHVDCTTGNWDVSMR